MNPLRPTWTVRFKEHQCLSMTRRSPKSLISTRSRKHTSWGPCLHQRPRRMMRLSNDSKIPCWVQSPWGDHEQFLISSNKFTVPRIPEICSGKGIHSLSSRCCSLVWDILSYIGFDLRICPSSITSRSPWFFWGLLFLGPKIEQRTLRISFSRQCTKPR